MKSVEKKKLLACGLALGLGVSLHGTAHAQAEFLYYGTLDFSYGRFEPSGAEPVHRFNSNSLTASHVGVRGSYGLDGGWTPGIQLEAFIRFQDFKLGRNDEDPILSRNAFAFLSNPKFGTLRVGRLQTLLFDTTNRFNAMGNSVAFSPAIRHIFASGDLEGVQRDFYWNRAASYVSPNLEGLVASVMYALGPTDQRSDLAGASLVFSRGLYAAALSAQRVHLNDGFNDPTDEQTWQLGATYNFGWARLFGLYTHTDDKGLDVRGNIYSGGAAVPLGPGTLQLQAGLTKASGTAVDRKHTSLSAAYVYAYDSVTDFYVVGMNDRVRRQTEGVSAAIGVRYRF
jgi:predicted porin